MVWLLLKINFDLVFDMHGFSKVISLFLCESLALRLMSSMLTWGIIFNFSCLIIQNEASYGEQSVIGDECIPLLLRSQNVKQMGDLGQVTFAFIMNIIETYPQIVC